MTDKTYGPDKLTIEQMHSNKKDAIAAGHLYYFTGKPCKNGHIVPRMVKGYGCLECQLLNSRKAFAKLKGRPDWELIKEKLKAQKHRCYENNKEKIRQKNRDRYQANKKKERVRDRARYKKNREKSIARTMEYYQKNREMILEKRKEYRKVNKEKISQQNKEYYLRKKKEESQKASAQKTYEEKNQH